LNKYGSGPCGLTWATHQIELGNESTPHANLDSGQRDQASASVQHGHLDREGFVLFHGVRLHQKYEMVDVTRRLRRSGLEARASATYG
jgi:hypothetical protein